MRNKTQLGVAGFLTGIAGFVDAVGFISLTHIYTANMSGNSVAIGIEAFAHNWSETLRRLCPVIAYVIGLLFCRLLIEFGARERIRRIASVAFLFEIGFLIPVCAANERGAGNALGPAFVYTALLAIAMGVQNAALTHFSSLTVHTGFVTGTLVKLAEEFAKFLTLTFDQLRSPDGSVASILANSTQQKPFQVASWLALMWTMYVVGAFVGALGDGLFQLRALVVPIISLAGLIAVDIHRPLALREEIEQSKLYT